MVNHQRQIYALDSYEGLDALPTLNNQWALRNLCLQVDASDCGDRRRFSHLAALFGARAGTTALCLGYYPEN